MWSQDVRIDVTGRAGLEGVLETAATVHLPDRIDGPLAVLVGYPGGSYGRRYYDIRRLPGYSQAKHHTDRGFAFIACDHLGTGDSSPVDMFELTVREEAAAITVPVLIGCGEIDVVPDPWIEPSAFRRSRDVTVFIVPRMCHMHNFARTRELLWERISRFAQGI